MPDNIGGKIGDCPGLPPVLCCTPSRFPAVMRGHAMGVTARYWSTYSGPPKSGQSLTILSFRSEITESS